MSILTVEHLNIWISQENHYKSVVRDLNFTIEKGETFALVGESGSGKSLTALAIMQLLSDNVAYGKKSRILLGDTDLLSLPEIALRNIRGRRIGMVFQEPMTALNPVLTIGAQLVEALQCHRHLTAQQAKKEALEQIKLVGISHVHTIYEAYPHQLSGGMKQRIVIAMALASEPDLLIADEPTTALDVTIQAQVIDLIQSLQKRLGMAILFITHDVALVSMIADKVAVMHKGHLVEMAAHDAFFKNPTQAYTKQLFAALPTPSFTLRSTLFPAVLSSPRRRGSKCAELNAQDDSTSVPLDPRLRGDDNTAEKLLTVENLQVYFPIRKGLLKRVKSYVKAVDGVSFSIAPGETVAVVGESGSGKTTLGKAIVQLYPAHAGTIGFQGKQLSLTQRNVAQETRRFIQMVFQDPYASLDPRMRIKDIIAEGLQAQGLWKNEREGLARIHDLLEQVGLSPESLYRYAHEFSGGQRQRIAIARALAVDPLLLICDEPTSALDVIVQAQILHLFQELQKKRNLAYLFITHNIAVVGYLADTVLVMHQGKIVESGPVAQVLQNPQHPYTQQLLAAVPMLEG